MLEKSDERDVRGALVVGGVEEQLGKAVEGVTSKRDTFAPDFLARRSCLLAFDTFV
jgi:hypothetical protein